MFSFLASNIQTSTQNEQKITQSCRKKYPHMIPIKVQVQQGIKTNKNKFLISQNCTGLQLQRHILKFIQRQLNQGLYFFVVDKTRHRMLQTNILVKQPYQMYKNQDGFLHLSIMKQNVF